MFTPGTKVGKYVLQKEMGKGAFGTVYRAIDNSTNKVFAVKVLRKKAFADQYMRRLLTTEVMIMREINHPNILHLFEFLQNDDYYFLVIQYCNQGDMTDWMKKNGKKKLAEPEAVKFLKHIMNGFMELRKRRILHRDFKLENVFVNDNIPIIGDFGLAKQGTEVTSTQLGTPLTQAPELLFNEDGKPYTSKADLWSIGCVYYEMLFGEPPFNGMSIPGLKADIRRKMATGLDLKGISPESKDLIKRLLCYEARDRIEWSEFFNHPLFKTFSSKTEIINNDLISAIKNLMINVTKADEEFENNQKIALNNKQDDFFQLGDLLAKIGQLEPSNMTINDEKANVGQITQQIDVQEIKAAYQHENNKISFLIYTVEKITRHFDNPAYYVIGPMLMDLGVLIARKAITLNNLLLQSLQSHSNILKYPGNVFTAFSNSQNESEMITLSKHVGNQADAAIRNLADLQSKHRFGMIYAQYFASGNSDINALDGALNYCYMNLRTYILGLSDSHIAFKIELVFLAMWCNLSLYCQTKFPFTPNESFPECKFDWGQFYAQLGRYSYNEMLMII
jgi:serine/threonine protein kinase